MVRIGGLGNLKVREATCEWKVFEFNPQAGKVWMGVSEHDTGLTGCQTV